MKCLYDQDRNAFYMVPTTPADRAVITNAFNMKFAGDFVLLVRQDVLDSDNVISHLEVSQALYSPPRAYSAYEELARAEQTENVEPDPRGGRGTRRTSGPITRSRRQAIQQFIASLPAGSGDVVVIPAGTTPTDPPAVLLKKR